jgi:hypothetical protein
MIIAKEASLRREASFDLYPIAENIRPRKDFGRQQRCSPIVYKNHYDVFNKPL